MKCEAKCECGEQCTLNAEHEGLHYHLKTPKCGKVVNVVW
jgi:hypothetical protein